MELTYSSQIFLILRDHLGDEHLGLSAGVLYELIEVDCQHTDDKGAAFQRWKHDHMNRHVSGPILSFQNPSAFSLIDNDAQDDLELPHVPHLTTVATAIVPTTILAEWRRTHPERYSTRLSDYASRPLPDANTGGCVRSRKNWSIDYTTYVSSRDNGTRPFRTIEPKDFHEIQWGAHESTKKGKFIEERSLGSSLDLPSTCNVEKSETTGLDNQLTVQKGSDVSKRRGSLSRLVRKVSSRKSTTVPKPSEPPTPSPSLPSASHSRDQRLDSMPNLGVNERRIPNSVFARKHGIYEEGSDLPIALREQSVAEDKAINTVADRAAKENLYSWRFQGPFTPQLWYDSGIEYKWKKPDGS